MEKEQVYASLCRVAEGIATTFGSRCETLIQDMSRKDHPVLAIYNGQVTGRSVGSTEDVYGNETRTDEKSSSVSEVYDDMVNQIVVTRSGKFLKSTTFNFTGDGYHYALGINFDATEMKAILPLLEELVSANTDLLSSIQSHNTKALTQMFNECVVEIGKAPSAMNKAERLRLLRRLNEQNALEYYKAVTFIAEKLGVTRNTVYNYLKEI